MSVSEPSQFWQRLGDEHQRQLESSGFSMFKRAQALRYFTWQWRWRSITKSEQMRFLLRHTSPSDWVRCAFPTPDLSDSAWQGVPWSRRDRWLYNFAVRLLWTYAESHDTAGVLLLPEPVLGSPFPVFWRGRLISQDIANSALEVSTIVDALTEDPASILEVGAGYGRTAYVLLNLFRAASYTIVDINPALEISRRYLTELFPGRSLRFLSPDEAFELEDSSIDLALSISSLQEMTLKQVERYLGLFDRVAAGGNVYLKQWSSWYNPDDKITITLDDYPVPPRWRMMFRFQAPVQSRFTEALWNIPKASLD